jgi:hypothetical protein
MGEFLAVSAFRDQPVDALTAAICRSVATHGVACDEIGEGPSEEAVDALVFPPANGWTVVLWPPYFNVHDIPMCAAISRELAALTSTVHVHDGDYWTHVVYDAGELVDRFASLPEYFTDDPGEALALTEAWAGDADRVAGALGTSPESVRPYLVHGLDDFWMFADLWKQVGIAYPEDLDGYERILRLGADFKDRLPTGGDL